ncbi:hypothetical protein [Methylobacterium sp. Leaf117]|uniref:hypothetical protein n=1 Tax=Methylobacterium sp. Leaf117 TaxID=1736260 RepID=UPI000724FF92|nr:hypothetical protein [Methylobacterium sp. Leaf117]KQP80317.1 hypothetical protein ASF57_18225 [Methylobacterium sp. Leaf117]
MSETVSLSLGKPTIDVSVQSTVKLAGTTRLCLLALDPIAMGAFHLESAARISAPECSFYSNFIGPVGI